MKQTISKTRLKIAGLLTLVLNHMAKTSCSMSI
uniref:Uncharacterized protein n=1 Tax=Rhizophora mucronata TaxID=61149 RepID=A0A2P2Q6I4_RHIMU